MILGWFGFGISFHLEIIRVVVAWFCRTSALPAASRLNTNDLEMESLCLWRRYVIQPAENMAWHMPDRP